MKNGQAVCSCVPGYLGNPPICRPECVVSSDCPPNESCSNQKCINPCVGSCGLGARCTVANRNPICHCPEGFTGDPFIRCLPLRKFLFLTERFGAQMIQVRICIFKSKKLQVKLNSRNIRTYYCIKLNKTLVDKILYYIIDIYYLNSKLNIETGY